jgi:hypothetical protein
MKSTTLKTVCFILFLTALGLPGKTAVIKPDTVKEILPDTGIILTEDTTHINWKITTTCNNAHFSRDIAPGGGAWAIQLRAFSKGGNDYASYYITGIAGTYTYRLSYWCKIAQKTHYVLSNGSVRVGVVDKKGLLAQRKVMNVPDNDIYWTKHFITFKLTTKITDTIGIRLFGGSLSDSGKGHINPDGLVLFDKIGLVQIKTPPYPYTSGFPHSIGDIWTYSIRAQSANGQYGGIPDTMTVSKPYLKLYFNHDRRNICHIS